MSLTAKNSRDLLEFLTEILLILIFISPTVLQKVKIILLLLCILLICVDKSNFNRGIKLDIVIWGSMYISINFLFLAMGTRDNLKILLQLLPSFVIWPLLFFFLFVIPKVNINLSKIVRISLQIIIIFFFYTYFSYYIELPFLKQISIFFPYVINDYAGFVGYFSPSISSLIFLVPSYIITIYFRDEDNKLLKFADFLLLLLAMFALAIIGRRAMIINIFFSLLLCLIIDKIWFKKRNVFVFLFVVITTVVCLYGLLIIYFPETRILNIDTLLIREGDLQRILQYESLIDGWKESPLIGHGFGVNTKEVIRSYAVPGVYELTYIALLFQTGILGFLLYIGCYLWLVYNLFKISIYNKNIEYLSYTVGLVSVLIANATNPYMQSFDGIWVLFVGLKILNEYKGDCESIENY